MNEALIDKVENIEVDRVSDKMCVGEIIDINSDGHVFVDFAGNAKGPVQAYITHSIKSQMKRKDQLIGRRVLLAFNEEELDRPIIVDTLHSRMDTQQETDPLFVNAEDVDEVKVDGKRVIFNAEEEITLKCGKSSIELTKAGKITIRGAYLLNRSSGVNRIKGGSVQIN